MAEARKTSWILDFKDNASAGIKSINSTLDDTNSKMEKTGAGVGSLSKGLGSMGKGFGKISSGAGKASKKLDSMAKATKGASLMASGFLAKVGKDSMEWGKGLSFAQAQAEMTDTEIKDLGDSIQKMNKYSTSQELIDSAGMYASAGLVKDEIKGIMKITDQMTQVTGDAEIAGDVMLTAGVAFDVDLSNEEEATAVADKFAKGQALAKVSVGELNEAIKVSQGTIKSMNMTQNESLGMTTLLAKAGYTGSQAGTMLNSTYNDLINKSKDGKLAIGQFKMSLYDANGEMKSMPKIMEEIEKGTANMSEEQRNSALATVFGANSQKLLSAYLGQGTEEYKKMEKAMAGAGGQTEKMAKTMNDNIGGDLKQLKSTFKDALLGIGQELEPFARTVVQGLTKVSKAMKEMSPGMKKAVGFGAVFVAGLFPVITIGSKIFGGISKIAGGVSKLFGLLATNPMLLLVAGVVAGAFVIYKNWDKIKEAGQALKEKLSEVFGAVKAKWDSLKDAMSTVVQGTVGVVTDSFRSKVQWVEDKWNWLKNFLKASPKGKVLMLKDSFENGIKSVEEKWNKLKNFLKNPIKGTVSLVQNVKDKITTRGKFEKLKGHRTGINKIPHDGYNFTAHKDEMVLTKSTADAYRSAGGTRNTLPTTGGNNGGGLSVSIPEISVVVNTDGKDAYGDGQKAGQGVRDEIDRYFRDMGIVF